MSLRPTQSATFDSVRKGILFNFAKLVRAQEQTSSGKRILRPSDDAVGTSASLALRRQKGQNQSYLDSIQALRPEMSAIAGSLEGASASLTDARATILQAMSGTLSPSDRVALAEQIDGIRASLLDQANERYGQRYLFGGTGTTSAPFSETLIHGEPKVEYRGNGDVQSVRIGRSAGVQVNVPGDDVFGKYEPNGVRFGGLTGIQAGTSANSGEGQARLTIRHTTTTGAVGSLAFVAGGANDTIVNDHALNVDAAAGTVQLGTGALRAIPEPGDVDYTDYVVRDADGSELHLDFSGYGGGNISATVTGGAEVSLDEMNYVPIDFTETNLQLVDSETGTVLHIDTTQAGRAGRELVVFGGTGNIFDTLQGIADDLRNADGLDATKVVQRVGERLIEFDRSAENLRVAMGNVGSRMARLNNSEERLLDVEVELTNLISEHEDADLAEVILDLSRAEQTLQTAQATGARLIQNTLLNFLN